MKAGLVLHPSREAAHEIGAQIEEGVRAAGHEAILLDLDAMPPADLDVVVSVGGDGTFLRAARIAGRSECPVVGVKVGRLGFLTEVEPEQALALVLSTLRGETQLEERIAVTAQVERPGGSLPEQWALNEVIVEKSVRHRLLRLAVHIDGEPITTFSGDGVIVATPTGSTAYSFSAGGPIVTPTTRCLIFTPVAAHMVFDRSFVLDPDQTVRLEVLGDEAGILSTDGQFPAELPVGSQIVVRRAPRPVVFARYPGAGTFLARVRDKFELPRGGS